MYCIPWLSHKLFLNYRYGFIHRKSRNRLSSDRAGKLTYLSQNYKLLDAINGKPTSKGEVDGDQIEERNDVDYTGDENNEMLDENEDSNFSDDDNFVFSYESEQDDFLGF